MSVFPTTSGELRDYLLDKCMQVKFIPQSNEILEVELITFEGNLTLKFTIDQKESLITTSCQGGLKGFSEEILNMWKKAGGPPQCKQSSDVFNIIKTIQIHIATLLSSRLFSRLFTPRELYARIVNAMELLEQYEQPYNHVYNSQE